MELILFFLGWGFSFLSHEAGHAGFSYLTGGQVRGWRWKADTLGHLSVNGSLSSRHTSVLAGNLTQISTAKLTEKMGGSFWNGFTYGGYINPLIYSIRGNGDFKSLQRLSGIHRDAYRAWFFSLSLLSLTGVERRFSLTFGKDLEWNSDGLIAHRVKTSAWEDDLRVDLFAGIRPLEGLEIGVGGRMLWKQEKTTGFRAVQFKVYRGKSGEYLYLRTGKDLSIRLGVGNFLGRQCLRVDMKDSYLFQDCVYADASPYFLELSYRLKRGRYHLSLGYDTFSKTLNLGAGLEW